MALLKLHKTVGVRVGPVQVGGGAPVVVQSMTMTDTADAAATGQQCIELARGRDPRWCASPSTCPKPPRRCPRSSSGCSTPASRRRSSATSTTTATSCSPGIPPARDALDKYRINPGNVGTGRRRDEQFATICGVARDRDKPVRIGVNGGSLNQELVVAKMQENTDRDLGLHVRRDHQRVHGALGAAVDGAGARVRPAEGPDHHLVQDVAAARPDRRLSRARRGGPTSRCTSG